MPVITIRGSLGSGAPEIGRQVAEKLGLDYVDREIIAGLAARLQHHEQDVAAKEVLSGSLLGRIGEALERSYALGGVSDGVYLPAWQMPLDDTRYLEALESVIRDLAGRQSIVIRGRGSGFILGKDYPRALHVFIVAPLEVRVKRVMESSKLGEEAARQEIARFDTSGRRFIKRYFRAEWADPAHYDLVINTEYLTFEAATALVADAVRFKDRAAGGQAGTG
ncbi:MAG: cytidylate kinase-like family protein [Chloroflexota bacterium]